MCRVKRPDLLSGPSFLGRSLAHRTFWAVVRAVLAQELDAAGYPMAGKPAWPPAASVELRQLLGMLPHETFDATRLIRFAGMIFPGNIWRV